MKIQTSVSFQTSCGLLQKLVDTAERKSRENLKQFGGRLVLIEGGGYEKIWLETQPMGGEMYAKRNQQSAAFYGKSEGGWQNSRKRSV